MRIFNWWCFLDACALENRFQRRSRPCLGQIIHSQKPPVCPLAIIGCRWNFRLAHIFLCSIFKSVKWRDTRNVHCEAIDHSRSIRHRQFMSDDKRAKVKCILVKSSTINACMTDWSAELSVCLPRLRWPRKWCGVSRWINDEFRRKGERRRKLPLLGADYTASNNRLVLANPRSPAFCARTWVTHWRSITRETRTASPTKARPLISPISSSRISRKLI